MFHLIQMRQAQLSPAFPPSTYTVEERIEQKHFFTSLWSLSSLHLDESLLPRITFI